MIPCAKSSLVRAVIYACLPTKGFRTLEMLLTGVAACRIASADRRDERLQRKSPVVSRPTLVLQPDSSSPPDR